MSEAMVDFVVTDGQAYALAERRYALRKVAAGDYLLPSNDGTTLWRLQRYTDGPSAGLDWPRDREVWRASYWPEPIAFAGPIAWSELIESERWIESACVLESRAAAIDYALTPSAREEVRGS
jgi:hypothetical protein